MFTIAQINAAHSKVKSGSDFPSFIQNLIHLGVGKYETFVTDGHTEYSGKENVTITSDPKYPSLQISEQSDSQMFIHHLRNHQKGESDYMSFCKQSAACGVVKWIVDTAKMTCSYYDGRGSIMWTEAIPELK